MLGFISSNAVEEHIQIAEEIEDSTYGERPKLGSLFRPEILMESVRDREEQEQ